MKLLLLVWLCMTIPLGLTKDISANFTKVYEQNFILNGADLDSLANSEIVLIPGIASESFDPEDDRSILDFSFFFKSYFGAQKTHYQSLGLKVTKLRSSSKSIDEALSAIHEKMIELSNSNKKAIFITHSMGGVLLLDYLLQVNPLAVKNVRSLIFMQSPFYGSPVASVFLENPYHSRSFLGPMLHYFNVSTKTVNYLSLKNRAQYMQKWQPTIDGLKEQFPILTMGGAVGDHSSLFKPTINLMSHGCVSVLRSRCISPKIYNGPYDDSDGMVPFESTKLKDVDFVNLPGVDHGEPVLAMPFKNFDRVQMTDALLKIALENEHLKQR